MGINKILAWSSLILMFSCEKDIRVKAPAQPVKLVVNSITGVNAPFSAYVAKTAGILDLATPESYLVGNALVLLFENSVLKDTLEFSSTTGSYTVKNNTIPKAGFRYQIKASAADFNTAEAETVVPAGITIQSISRRQNVRADADSAMYDEVKIRFTDDAITSNYYLIRFRRPFSGNNQRVHYEDIYCMRSMDKDIDRRTDINPNLFEDCIDRGFMFADTHFNGSSKELIVYIRHHELESVHSSFDNRQYQAVAELNNITTDHYRYRKSYTAYGDSEDNPFAEPVLVYTNIKNGYGLFSAYNLAIDTIR